jgi:phosphoglucomutase
MYFELGTAPFSVDDYESIKAKTEVLLKEFEKAVLQHCYKTIGINFPERGFLIFWQVPMKDKLHYFEIEPEIEKLKELKDQGEKEEKLKGLLEFLGKDGVDKVNPAFMKKNKIGIREFLGLWMT